MPDRTHPRIPPEAEHWPAPPAPGWGMRPIHTFTHLSYPQISLLAEGLEWVGPSGEVRVPAESTRTFAAELPFAAAGRLYLSTKQLIAHRKPGPPSGWYLDRYGRQVYRYIQRFPCFDDCDGRTETRFYRWYFLFEGGRLTRIQHTDGQPILRVTEDAAFLEDECRRAMAEAGCPHCL